MQERRGNGEAKASENVKKKVSVWVKTPRLFLGILADAITHPLSDSTFDRRTGKRINTVP